MLRAANPNIYDCQWQSYHNLCPRRSFSAPPFAGAIRDRPPTPLRHGCAVPPLPKGEAAALRLIEYVPPKPVGRGLAPAAYCTPGVFRQKLQILPLVFDTLDNPTKIQWKKFSFFYPLLIDFTTHRAYNDTRNIGKIATMGSFYPFLGPTRLKTDAKSLLADFPNTLKWGGNFYE